MSGSSPRRRHSPAVYRRRRLVLLIALVAVVAVVWLLIAQPWSGSANEGDGAAPAATQDAASELPSDGVDPAPEPSGDATPAATPSAEPAATPSTTPTAAACTARDIEVEGLTDQTTYGSGQNPKLSIRLTNNGDEDCTLNVGTSTQVFTITSGSDTWWRSTDCQTTPSDMVVLLAAGQSVTSASPLVWDRTRSAVGTCAADASRPKAPGGGASYHLAVEIGGITAADTTQILLY